MVIHFRERRDLSWDEYYNENGEVAHIAFIGSEQNINIEDFKVKTTIKLADFATKLNIDTDKTINKVLQNFTPSWHNNANPYVSGFVDLFPIRNLYLTCSGLGNFNTMSVSGDRSIVKKIPVNAGYGEMIFDQSVVGIDYLDCSHQTLSRVGFQLKDVFGRVVDLHGNHFSFPIVFFFRISEIQ